MGLGRIRARCCRLGERGAGWGWGARACGKKSKKVGNKEVKLSKKQVRKLCKKAKSKKACKKGDAKKHCTYSKKKGCTPA